jgi:trehalose utilization protein
MLRITIWNENIHEKDTVVNEVYPLGIHGTIAAYLKENKEFDIKIATLDQPECGLTDEVLNSTDVLFWWGHAAHEMVPDDIARKVVNRVLLGMGLIVLHSAHYSKPFKLLMGTSCSLRWRDSSRERLWCLNPGHPITAGVPACFDLECEEMYGEFFDIPKPDELVYGGWFDSGEIFRSGCGWYRGAGKVFYFQPGHETNTAYHNPYVLKILENAALWAAPVRMRSTLECFHKDETTNEITKEGKELDQY